MYKYMLNSKIMMLSMYFLFSKQRIQILKTYKMIFILL